MPKCGSVWIRVWHRPLFWKEMYKVLNSTNSLGKSAVRKALPGFEPGISCLQDRRTNLYATEPYSEMRATICAKMKRESRKNTSEKYKHMLQIKVSWRCGLAVKAPV